MKHACQAELESLHSGADARRAARSVGPAGYGWPRRDRAWVSDNLTRGHLRVAVMMRSGTAKIDLPGRPRPRGDHLAQVMLTVADEPLPIVFRIPACLPDTRGNRLERYEVVHMGSWTRVRLCTSEGVAKHLGAVLTHLGVRASLSEADDDEYRNWTHDLDVEGALPAEAMDLLDLLNSTLLLVVPPELESAIALDWYKVPDENVDPKEWANTPAGGLVHRMKYSGSGSAQARRQLAMVMAQVVRRHPLYRECILATVPGHDASIDSHGERLARDLAELTGRPLIATKAKHPLRPEAKSGEKFDLANEFTVDEGATLAPVLIVDDVYRSGGHLQGVAAAARRAGALSVHGIIGARTMRK